MSIDKEAIRARHYPIKVQTGSKTNGGPAEYGEACGTCYRRWPCEQGVLLDALDERDRQRDAVLALHQESMMGAARLGWCAEDGRSWPCATARALGVSE